MRNALFMNILVKLIFAVVFIYLGATIVSQSGWNILALLCALFATHDIVQIFQTIQLQKNIKKK